MDVGKRGTETGRCRNCVPCPRPDFGTTNLAQIACLGKTDSDRGRFTLPVIPRQLRPGTGCRRSEIRRTKAVGGDWYSGGQNARGWQQVDFV